MTISRTTVDKLGIRMYDKPSAVLAELVANAYDADAENVTISTPLNKWLATGRGAVVKDGGYEIVVEDDGIGMVPEVINDFYLNVGRDRRADPLRGALSAEKNRPVMGRKGIGKLAPFGICSQIEVWTAGGKKTDTSFRIAHFILNYEEIIKDTDTIYQPDIGPDDGQFADKRGTRITLRNFHRTVIPDGETFRSQLARRFGTELPDFRVWVIDATTQEKVKVGTLDIPIEEATKIDVADRPVVLEDGTKLPVKGWVAYATSPYKNEEIAGVRIYARGKIVSSTRDFGLSAGFQGEFNIRSYLVGKIEADWIDANDGEDLTRTDRQDILWDTELGAAFKKWGQDLLKDLGKKSRTPMREKAWDTFARESDLESEAKKRFGNDELVQTAMTVGKTIGQIAHREDLKDTEYVKDLRNLILTITPHKMLVDSLREAGEKMETSEDPLGLVVKVFKDAKIAEASSIGQVAMERINILKKLETALNAAEEVPELELQKLLEEAPWLIDPRWTVLQANKSFGKMRKAFEDWHKKEYGQEIATSALVADLKQRPDFIMIHVGTHVEIVEIKQPGHHLENNEFDRIDAYRGTILKFLDENGTFKDEFRRVHITVICDGLKLSSVYTRSMEKLIDDNELTRKTWREVLKDAQKIHEDFVHTLESKAFKKE